METFIQFIQENAANAHFIIFGLLLLAGFNIPVSEDGMLFVSALIASKYPENFYHLFFGVFLGAYFSDLICYTLGRYLGPKIWNIQFFAKMVSRERVQQLSSFYEKYGVFTLIFGRFIPFGVRNGLFLTAGLGKMNFLKFALSDLLACTISCTLFFNLYYKFGETVIEYVKKGNVVIFSIFSVLVLIFLLKKKKVKKTT
ncbi:MAG: alkaline phosphatase [Halobacteriovoraceae bacterium]|nr:alkaline phosphatase [Halobacteriovoraceae bacterium]